MLLKVLTGKLTFESLNNLDLTTCTKSDIIEYFNNSYDLNESLFTSFKSDNVFYKCPDSLRLPLIFYYGHTAAVYVNKLILSGLIQHNERINFEFETIFETGVDEMSWDDVENFRMGSKYKWPNLDDTINFRRKVRQLIINVIKRSVLHSPINMENSWWSLIMGMKHERIHLETSSVLIRQLPIELLERPIGWSYAPYDNKDNITNDFLRVSQTTVRLGKDSNDHYFGWDNEYGNTLMNVPEFEASRYLVSNGEFLKFVLDGGYKNMEFWSVEGWKWVQFKNPKHPCFWICSKECKSSCGSNLSSYSHCRDEVLNLSEQNQNNISNNKNGHYILDSETKNQKIISSKNNQKEIKTDLINSNSSNIKFNNTIISNDNNFQFNNNNNYINEQFKITNNEDLNELNTNIVKNNDQIFKAMNSKDQSYYSAFNKNLNLEDELNKKIDNLNNATFNSKNKDGSSENNKSISKIDCFVCKNNMKNINSSFNQTDDITCDEICEETYVTRENNEKEQEIKMNKNMNISKLDENYHYVEKHLEFKYRCIFNVIDMPMKWPVDVNYYEAKAFCAWKGKDYRLLAEAEYKVIRNGIQSNKLPVNNEDIKEANINMAFGSSTCVNHYAKNKLGFHDSFGNVWQWLEDHFNGLDGYQSHPFYDDFSSPCFDGQHTMIGGGSWISTGIESNESARFAFRRHFFQHLGFRIVRNVRKNNENEPFSLPIRLIKSPNFALPKIEYPFRNNENNLVCKFVETSNRQYLQETEDYLAESFARDYCSNFNDEFLIKCIQLFDLDNLNLLKQKSSSLIQAIHIGCDTGGLVFKLKGYFDKVIGIDIYKSTHDVCTKILNEKIINGSSNHKEILYCKNSISFKQFTWIPNEVEYNYLVLYTMTNRANNNKAWYLRFKEIVQINGFLVVSYSDKNNLSLLKNILINNFVLLDILEIPYLENKYQFSAWKRLS